MFTPSVPVQYVHASKAPAPKPFGFSGFGRLNYFKWKPSYQGRKVVQMNASLNNTARIEGRKVNGIIPDKKVSGLRDVNESLCEEKISGRHGDSIMELTNMAALALAGEKQEKIIDRTKNRGENDVPVDAFRLGRLVEGKLLYRQTYVIRSYEVGVDKTASIETLMNLLQETSLNHVSAIGLAGDGFGTTPEMRRRNLIWVVSRMQVQVDLYPSWCDVVEVDTWVSPSGKNGMRRDWFVRDFKSGHILTRATSTWVAMNSETRRLSKIPEEVKEEAQPFNLERRAVVADDSKRLPKLDYRTAQCTRSDLIPKWNDLDVNQHVNNVKYVGWILESVPVSILESNELRNMTLEYRRECGQTDVLQSLTSCTHSRKSTTNTSSEFPVLECMHLLRMQSDGAEILRARTDWRPKSNNDYSTFSF